MANLVVCGLSDTIETFCPTRAFTNVDLPTLGRPTTAITPQRNGRSDIKTVSSESLNLSKDTLRLTLTDEGAEIFGAEGVRKQLAQRPPAALSARRLGDDDEGPVRIKLP